MAETEKLWTRSRYTNSWEANLYQCTTKKKFARLSRDLGRKTVLLEEMVTVLLQPQTNSSRAQIKEKYRKEFLRSGLELPDVLKSY